MILKLLKLSNFRNYEDLALDFHSGSNIIIGQNGQGKTNILESIFMLAMIKSFRLVQDKDIINRKADSYYIHGEFYKNKLQDTYILAYHNKKKRLQENGNIIEKLTSHIGNIKVVVFTQEDIQLIYGSPSLRRKYLDIAFSLTSKHYFENLKRFQHCVRLRNSTLKKDIKLDEKRELIRVWNEQLIEYGANIIQYRLEHFEEINNLTQRFYNELNFQMNDFHIIYKSSLGNQINKPDIKSIYKTKLIDNENREIQYKQTLYGPHKDDFIIKSGQHEFKKFASQGQNRAGALTLKLAMTYFIESFSENKSILLMDDILLDLDQRKKEAFLKLLEGRQCFFTSTSLYGFEEIEKESKVFEVFENQVKVRD